MEIKKNFIKTGKMILTTEKNYSNITLEIPVRVEFRKGGYDEYYRTKEKNA